MQIGPKRRRTQGRGQWRKEKRGKGHEEDADDNKYEWERKAMAADMN
jgi:hypothetical protein